MTIPKYFTLQEFLSSTIAKQEGVQNLPSFEVVDNLRELALFLDPLREAWGSGIRVTSGFRNEVLNGLVGGVPTSCHRLGTAVDMVPVNGKFEEFKKFVVDYLKDKAFDECIIEKNSKGDTWIHLQLYSPKGFQRKKIFSLDVK